jgi:hypothetical protein
VWARGSSSTFPRRRGSANRYPAKERVALYNAVAKLEVLGSALGFPHASAVKGADNLRELRPRAGRSPWRGLYRMVGERFVIAAVAPEAEHDPPGFKRAGGAAEKRLEQFEE